MDDRLKPCPFCGGTETAVVGSQYWTGRRNEQISVTIRHWCSVPAEVPGPARGLMEVTRATEEEAIEAWNTRAQPKEI